MQVKDILRVNYLAVSADETLSQVFGKMKRGRHQEAVVLDDKGHYAGMLWKRALIRTRIDPSQAKVRKFVTSPATLTGEVDLREAARLMHESDFHVLPVLDGKRVLGICGARDVLAQLQERLADRKAVDVATTTLITLRDSDSIGAAVTILRERHIDRIPLLDKNGHLAGIVSLPDLLERYLLASPKGASSGRHGKHGRTSKSGQDAGDRPNYEYLPLENIMTKLVVTASPNARATDIIKLLRDNEVSSVILVQNDLPVGIVTTKDLLHEVSRT